MQIHAHKWTVVAATTLPLPRGHGYGYGYGR